MAGPYAKKIRKEHEYSDTLILMLTAESTDADRIIGKVQGADEYVTKPFDRKELISVVKNLLTDK